ncbi:MAG: capsular biosynthesis protein, partial [Alphaproteobacteria bacterium]
IYDVSGLTAATGLDAFWQAPTAPDADLVADFVKAVAATVLVRGTYYSEPGLTAAVEGSAARLLERAVNRPLALAAE